MIKKCLALLFVLVAPSFFLASCNTMHGLGEDIQAGGNALSRAAAPQSKKSTSKITVTQTKLKQ